MKVDDRGLAPYYNPKVDPAAKAKMDQFASVVNGPYKGYKFTSPEDARQMHLDRTAFIKSQQPKQTPSQKPGSGVGQNGQTAGGGTMGYQTGFNANAQALNEGHILGRLGAEGGGPTSQFSGVNDLRKSQQMNDQAQLRRGIQQENAQQHMNDQAARSEIMQTAASNMAKMYGDMTQRNISQMGLANQLQEAMIRNRNALAKALTQT